MTRTFFYGFAALLVAVAAWGHVPFGTANAEATNVVKVTANELESGKVVVIGNLGTPLKTMQAVRGTWQHPGGKSPSKDFDLSFHVTHVNGKALDKPVRFQRRVVDVKFPLPWEHDEEEKNGPTPTAGETWEIRADETARFCGRPDDYNRELGTHLNSDVQSPVWWSPFLLEFHGIMQRPVAPAEKPEQGKSADVKRAKP